MLVADALLLLRNNIAGEGVHEVLGTSLSGTELTQTVRLLLVKHLAVFKLSLNISLDLGLSLVVGRQLVSLVLAQHLLEVIFFLATLLLLQLTLHIHLLLQAVNQFDFLAERILVLVPLARLFFTQLSVSALLLLCDLFALGCQLFLLADAEEFDMLLLERLVHAPLLHFVVLTLTLLRHLLIKLIPYQSSALLLSQHRLLLLFVMQQRVELLNGGPLVFLGQLRINLGTAVGLTRCNAVLISATDLASRRANARRLRTSPRAGYRFDGASISIFAVSSGARGT